MSGELEPIKSNDVPFEKWLSELPGELAKRVVSSVEEAHEYIKQTGHECWREMYDDDLTPSEAASAEYDAAMSLQ
jgi:hypothetical protein